MQDVVDSFGRFLVRADYWLLWLLVVTTAISIWCNRSSLILAAREVPKTAVPVLCIILFSAALLRLNPTRWEHNVFDDEYCHGQLAYNLSHRFVNTLSDHLPGETEVAPATIWPPGYHFILGNLLRLSGGYTEQIAFLLNAVAGTLCVIAMFLLAFMLFANAYAALMAAAFVALWPLHIRLSNGASTEIVAHLALSLFAICLILYSRAPSTRGFSLVSHSASWAALIRPELVLLVPVTAAIAGGLYCRTKKHNRWLLCGIAALSLPLLLPSLHLLFSISRYGQFRQMNLQNTLGPAILYWVRPGLYNPCWTALGFCGAAVLWREKMRAAVTALLGVWIADVLLVGAYLKVDPNLADLQRYFVLGGTVPLLISAYFLGVVCTRQRALAVVLFTVAFVSQCLLIPNAKHSMSPMAEGRRAQSEWLAQHRHLVPENAVVFSSSPAFVWAITGWRTFHVSRMATYLPTYQQLRLSTPIVAYRGFDTTPDIENLRIKRSAPLPDTEIDPSEKTGHLWSTSTIAEGWLLGESIGLYSIHPGQTDQTLERSGEDASRH